MWQKSGLAKCLEELKNWADRNYLKLNDNKTQLLRVSKSSYSSPLRVCLKLMGQTLKVENCAKYLGVWLDSRLSTTRQINSVCSQGYILWKIYGEFHLKYLSYVLGLSLLIPVF